MLMWPWGGTWGHGVAVGRYLVTRGGCGEVPGDMGWPWGGTWGHGVSVGGMERERETDNEIGERERERDMER